MLCVMAPCRGEASTFFAFGSIGVGGCRVGIESCTGADRQPPPLTSSPQGKWQVAVGAEVVWLASLGRSRLTLVLFLHSGI
jgi:hypothetical protein